MTVNVLKTVAGRDFTYRPGEQDVPDDIAEMLLKAGHAEKVKRGKRGKSNSVGDSTSTSWTGSDATDGD